MRRCPNLMRRAPTRAPIRALKMVSDLINQNFHNRVYALLTSAFPLGPTFLGFPLRSHRNRNFIDIDSSSDDDDNDTDLEDGEDDDDDDLEMIEFEMGGKFYLNFPTTTRI